MKQFSDGKQVWCLRWTVSVCRDVQGLDYQDGQRQKQLNPGILEEWLTVLYANPVLCADLVFAAARRQHPDRTKEQLEDILVGETLDQAREALIDEIINFSQSQTGRHKQLAAMASEFRSQLKEVIEETISQLTRSDSQPNLPENLASTEES